MTSKARKILLVLMTIVIVGFGGVYMTYYLSMKDANEKGKQMKCLEMKAQAFLGTITEINRYDYDDFMHKNFFSLSIKTNDTDNKFIDYQFSLEPNKHILDFAKAGQTIVKSKNSDTFDIVDMLGIKRTFKIPYCD